MLMLPQSFVSYIVDACGSNNMLSITVKAMDFKNNLKKMKVHCEAVIIGPSCLSSMLKRGCEQKPEHKLLTRKIIMHGQSERSSLQGEKIVLVSPTAAAELILAQKLLRQYLSADFRARYTLIDFGKNLKTQTLVNSYFSRCLWSISAGQSPFSLLPLLRPFLKRLLSEPRLLPLSLQPTAARCDPQFWEEVWFHAEGNPGVRLWQWHLHSLSHGLGKAFKHFSFKQTLLNDHRTMIANVWFCFNCLFEINYLLWELKTASS